MKANSVSRNPAMLGAATSPRAADLQRSAVELFNLYGRSADALRSAAARTHRAPSDLSAR